MKIFFILCFFGMNVLLAQEETKPKLVVGIVIDQMRAEYLYRFQDNYSEAGFKRLVSEGFNVKNTHYNYIPTATGPGHASIYTGTTPENHSIVNNDWYDRRLRKMTYCALDTTVTLVDSDKKRTTDVSMGRRSPKNLKTTTITDELKLFSNNRSKVIGISLKDRSAIFPAGHMADAAYWYNPENGNFVSSTYYQAALPKWLIAFNRSKKADSLLNLTWNPFLPEERYAYSAEDNAAFEKIYEGRKTATLPYDLKKLRKKNGGFKLIAEVPFGNTLVTQLAIEALKKEKLGQQEETDFLTISYSATDYVGHYFGIRSRELEDTYIRMDREIATLLKTLDQEVGKGNYTLFLTADHGVSDNPYFLEKSRLPGRFYDPLQMGKALNANLSEAFGATDYIAFIDKTQLYFNETATAKASVIQKAASFLRTMASIKAVFTPNIGRDNSYESNAQRLFNNSFYAENSGDIIMHFHSGWMVERPYGTTHGSMYTSDTHVPLLWYGHGIPKGETIEKHHITQIAPTLSMLLNIPFPNSSDTKAIGAIFED